MERQDSAEISPRDQARDEEGPPVLFPTWNALYTAVIVYSGILILIFYILSVTLDYSGGQ